MSATALACALAAVGVLRSHLLPLVLLVLLGAVVGLILAVGHVLPGEQRRDLVRLPLAGAIVVLVLVGIGQLGLLGLLLGGILLALAPAWSAEREHRP